MFSERERSGSRLPPTGAEAGPGWIDLKGCPPAAIEISHTIPLYKCLRRTCWWYPSRACLKPPPSPTFFLHFTHLRPVLRHPAKSNKYITQTRSSHSLGILLLRVSLGLCLAATRTAKLPTDLLLLEAPALLLIRTLTLHVTPGIRSENTPTKRKDHPLPPLIYLARLKQHHVLSASAKYTWIPFHTDNMSPRL